MIRFSTLLVLMGFSAMLHAQTAVQEQADWAEVFERLDAEGTIAVLDGRQPEPLIQVHNSGRAQQRFSPASTFKIPHTLFLLDAGLVRDEFQVFAWDGTQYSFPGHNQDQNLRSAMRTSALWVYAGLAEELGTHMARRYLQRIDYGNADPSVSEGSYWVDGALAISAVEQVDFLQRLYLNSLPFPVEHQRLVKDLMIVEAAPGWILRAKTGWEGRWGWWVGWVELPEGPVFFALNIDTPERMDDLYKREAISREILGSIGALPKP